MVEQEGHATQHYLQAKLGQSTACQTVKKMKKRLSALKRCCCYCIPSCYLCWDPIPSLPRSSPVLPGSKVSMPLPILDTDTRSDPLNPDWSILITCPKYSILIGYALYRPPFTTEVYVATWPGSLPLTNSPCLDHIVWRMSLLKRPRLNTFAHFTIS